MLPFKTFWNIDFKFSAPDFASSNPSLITNNNTIFYGDAKDPLDIEDGSKFNYQVWLKNKNILKLHFVQLMYYCQVCSIVSHHGSTATSGHYVADVLRFDPEVEGRWFRFVNISTSNILLLKTVLRVKTSFWIFKNQNILDVKTLLMVKKCY